MNGTSFVSVVSLLKYLQRRAGDNNKNTQLHPRQLESLFVSEHEGNTDEISPTVLRRYHELSFGLRNIGSVSHAEGIEMSLLNQIVAQDRASNVVLQPTIFPHLHESSIYAAESTQCFQRLERIDQVLRLLWELRDMTNSHFDEANVIPSAHAYISPKPDLSTCIGMHADVVLAEYTKNSLECNAKDQYEHGMNDRVSFIDKSVLQDVTAMKDVQDSQQSQLSSDILVSEDIWQTNSESLFSPLDILDMSAFPQEHLKQDDVVYEEPLHPIVEEENSKQEQHSHPPSLFQGYVFNASKRELLERMFYWMKVHQQYKPDQQTSNNWSTQTLEKSMKVSKYVQIYCPPSLQQVVARSCQEQSTSLVLPTGDSMNLQAFVFSQLSCLCVSQSSAIFCICGSEFVFSPFFLEGFKSRTEYPSLRTVYHTIQPAQECVGILHDLIIPFWSGLQEKATKTALETAVCRTIEEYVGKIMDAAEQESVTTSLLLKQPENVSKYCLLIRSLRCVFAPLLEVEGSANLSTLCLVWKDMTNVQSETGLIASSVLTYLAHAELQQLSDWQHGVRRVHAQMPVEYITARVGTYEMQDHTDSALSLFLQPQRESVSSMQEGCVLVEAIQKEHNIPVAGSTVFGNDSLRFLLGLDIAARANCEAEIVRVLEEIVLTMRRVYTMWESYQANIVFQHDSIVAHNVAVFGDRVSALRKQHDKQAEDDAKTAILKKQLQHTQLQAQKKEISSREFALQQRMMSEKLLDRLRVQQLELEGRLATEHAKALQQQQHKRVTEEMKSIRVLLDWQMRRNKQLPQKQSRLREQQFADTEGIQLHSNIPAEYRRFKWIQKQVIEECLKRCMHAFGTLFLPYSQAQAFFGHHTRLQDEYSRVDPILSKLSLEQFLQHLHLILRSHTYDSEWFVRDEDLELAFEQTIAYGYDTAQFEEYERQIEEKQQETLLGLYAAEDRVDDVMHLPGFVTAHEEQLFEEYTAEELIEESFMPEDPVQEGSFSASNTPVLSATTLFKRLETIPALPVYHFDGSLVFPLRTFALPRTKTQIGFVFLSMHVDEYGHVGVQLNWPTKETPLPADNECALREYLSLTGLRPPLLTTAPLPVSDAYTQYQSLHSQPPQMMDSSIETDVSTQKDQVIAAITKGSAREYVTRVCSFLISCQTTVIQRSEVISFYATTDFLSVLAAVRNVWLGHSSFMQILLSGLSTGLHLLEAFDRSKSSFQPYVMNVDDIKFYGVNIAYSQSNLAKQKLKERDSTQVLPEWTKGAIFSGKHHSAAVNFEVDIDAQWPQTMMFTSELLENCYSSIFTFLLHQQTATFYAKECFFVHSRHKQHVIKKKRTQRSRQKLALHQSNIPLFSASTDDAKEYQVDPAYLFNYSPDTTDEFTYYIPESYIWYMESQISRRLAHFISTVVQTMTIYSTHIQDHIIQPNWAAMLHEQADIVHKDRFRSVDDVLVAHARTLHLIQTQLFLIGNGVPAQRYIAALHNIVFELHVLTLKLSKLLIALLDQPYSVYTIQPHENYILLTQNAPVWLNINRQVHPHPERPSKLVLCLQNVCIPHLLSHAQPVTTFQAFEMVKKACTDQDTLYSEFNHAKKYLYEVAQTLGIHDVEFMSVLANQLATNGYFDE